MDVRKVTVKLPEDQIEFLQKTAAAESVSFTYLLCRAINSEKFFVEQERVGRKVLVEDNKKVIREVIRQ